MADRDGCSEMTEIRADNTVLSSSLLSFVNRSRNPLVTDDTEPSSKQPLFRLDDNVTGGCLSVSDLLVPGSFLFLFGGMFSTEA